MPDSPDLDNLVDGAAQRGAWRTVPPAEREALRRQFERVVKGETAAGLTPMLAAVREHFDWDISVRALERVCEREWSDLWAKWRARNG